MAKSRCGSLPLNVVRGLSVVHDPEASDYGGGQPSLRGREQCLARARDKHQISSTESQIESGV
jgi:hypothetical protein